MDKEDIHVVAENAKSTLASSQGANLDGLFSVKKKVFSFRGPLDDVKTWRTYAVAADITVDTLGTLALNEYMANHPLENDQKLIFDIKCKNL